MMRFRVFLITIAIFVLKPYQLVEASKVYPCVYADTVNITEGLRHKDGSYSYQGLLIPANLTAEYKFKVIDGVEYGASRHIRGCICRLKPCITFCCPPDMLFNVEHQNCTAYKETNVQHPHQSHIDMTYLNGSVVVRDIRESFVIRYEMGCKRKYVNKKQEKFWKWDLFANGSLLRDSKYYSTDEYCFTPLEQKKVWSLAPLICERHQHGFRVWIYAICTLLAIIINLFILIMLISIKDVRNTGYGESIIFYLASIVIGFSALVYLSLKNPMNLSQTACRNIGFLAYFFLMLSFFFLVIISWDLWYNLRSKRLGGWRRKIIYFVAIALAFGLKIVTRYAQDSNIANNLKPGIGDVYCWFDMRLWGIFIYYYLPILLCLGFCGFCLFKAFSTIWHLPRDTQYVAGYDVRAVKSQVHAFSAYLLAVFCVWAREMIVYILARIREHYFIIDFWSGICVLALAVAAFIFLLYKNKLVHYWWGSNVSNKPVENIYTIRTQLPTHKTGKLKKNGNDEYEEIALQ